MHLSRKSKPGFRPH